MAEPELRHDVRLAQDPDGTTPSNGASLPSTGAQTEGSAPTPASLPLRKTSKQPMAQPKIHDITERFSKACSALEVGQLVKDEYFTLFESIGAIEIMDSKMDSGFLQANESLDDTYDPLAPLLPSEIIGIMDQLLCYEMAWHTGYPLSQTLFTSIYIDKLLWPEPRAFAQAQFYRGEIGQEKRPGTLLEVLRAYCLALIKGCDFVIAKITGRDYFEEEDFCTHTYNRVLFVRVPIDVFLRECDAAIEMMEETDLDFEIDDALRSAIITRLEFRKAFLTALDLDGPLGSLSSNWPPLFRLLCDISSTHHLGTPVPSSFSTKIQRSLASTVPPRPIVELDFNDALEKLKQLCTDCEEATRFAALPKDPLEYEAFLWTFSGRLPTPLPYSRSYLATILFHPDVLNAPISLPLEDVKALVFHASPILDPMNWALSPPRNSLLPKSPRLQLALLIDEFIESVGQPYLDLWVTLGQNRCRLRRMLTHVIQSWNQLQLDAKEVDADLAIAYSNLTVSDACLTNPLSTWVYVKKLWMIERVILLGFEQDIYLPDEFAGMYYFLSLISEKRKEAFERCNSHVIERIQELSKEGRLHETHEVDNGAPYVAMQLEMAKGVSAFATALQNFYTILLYLGLLPVPKRPSSSEQLRYELRMKPFLTLHPPEVPQFQDFKVAMHPYGPYTSSPSTLEDTNDVLWVNLDTFLKQAKDSFAKVKKYGASNCRVSGVEQAWNKEVQGLLASCIALGVATAGVKSAVKDSVAGADLGIKVEIPQIATGNRYVEGWVVGKVIKT